MSELFKSTNDPLEEMVIWVVVKFYTSKKEVASVKSKST